MKKIPKIDIGLVWAKIVNIWGQLGTVAGMANTIMMIGVFYSTTLYPHIKIPLWLYLMVIISGASLVIWFIIKIGISGWFRFFSSHSEIAETNRKLDLVMTHLNIADEKKKK